jgi:hypothetical protein
MMKKLITMFCIVLFYSLKILSQTTGAAQSVNINSVQSGKFDRKSVTIVPLSLNNNYDQLSNMIEISQHMNASSRFDFNYLSKSELENAQSLFSRVSFDKIYPNNSSNFNVLENIIRDSKILDAVIESAGNIDSISARVKRSQKRITTTATESMKISRPTVAEMIKLINGAFIGIPVLFESVVNNGNGVATGCYYWFRLDVSNVKTWDPTTNLPAVNEIVLTQYDSFSDNYSVQPYDKNNLTSILLNSVSDETSAELAMPLDIRAARKFTRKALDKILNKDEFKVRGTIQDVSNGIRFDLGKREGIYLDQGYKVYELRLNNNNKTESHYVGFARVNKVADNRVKIDALSDLYPIIGSYDAGYTVASHDQLFDVSVKPSFKTVKVPKEFGSVLAMYLDKDISQTFGIDGEIKYNIAPLIGATQLFIGAEVGLGFSGSKVLTDNIDGLTVSPPMCLDIYGFLQKKIWFFRTALTFQIEAGYSSFGISGKYNDNDWGVSTGSFGFGGSVGLQYAISPDINFGITAGYREVLKPVSLHVVYADQNKIDYKKTDNPYIWSMSNLDNFDLSGVELTIEVSYSIPY